MNINKNLPHDIGVILSALTGIPIMVLVVISLYCCLPRGINTEGHEVGYDELPPALQSGLMNMLDDDDYYPMAYDPDGKYRANFSWSPFTPSATILSGDDNKIYFPYLEDYIFLIDDKDVYVSKSDVKRIWAKSHSINSVKFLRYSLHELAWSNNRFNYNTIISF